MYQAAFRSIDNTLREDAGCNSELDYIEQTSWILFLKYLDDYQTDQADSALLNGQTYAPLLSGEFSWQSWASPKLPDGKLNHNAALSGDDLHEFVNSRLFPHLRQFKIAADNPNTLKYKIGEIFSELRNKLQSGYNLRKIINKTDTLSFLSNDDKHELSSLYEDKIKNMGNAGRNGGEYYTPRPLIKSIVQIINPVIGETVYDGAAGSAGFLCEAYTHIRNSKQLGASEYTQLQSRTLYGKEKKSLAYVIGIMNMILHGIEAPNIVHTNTLGENINDILQKNRVNVVLANPPFGGNERHEIRQNFPIASGETAYLFLQHFIKILKAGGRGGVVIKNTFLSNTDNASVALRKQLLEECRLFAVLDLPSGAFIGTGVKTVVLFFEKGRPTQQVWYYQLKAGRNMGKTNPLNEGDLAEFVTLAQARRQAGSLPTEAPPTTLGDNSWLVTIADISRDTWDLSVNNPHVIDQTDTRNPQQIIAEIEQLDSQAAQALKTIKDLL